MSLDKPKYVERFVDRHGRVRYYFRCGKGERTPLPGEPGSHAFQAAYVAALKRTREKAERKVRGNPGTFDRLVQEYLESPDYLRLATQTQMTYASVIERFLIEENVGHRLVREMTRKHVQKIVAKRAATPGAANQLLKKLKVLLHFAIDNGWRTDDPTIRIKTFPEGEIHTWTDAEIDRFEATWKIGTRERLMFALFLYSGQRTSDVAKMLWTEVSNDGIWVVQRKTKAKLLVPLHPELYAILSTSPRRRGAILQTNFGRPFTSKGLSNFMATRIGKAGLPERCVTHGLRKAAARRLAEAGCSANEIAAITGHASLEEVARYTKAAEQRKLARSAMDRLVRDQHGIPTSSHTEGLGFGDQSLGKMTQIPPAGSNTYANGWRPVGDSNPCSQRERLVS